MSKTYGHILIYITGLVVLIFPSLSYALFGAGDIVFDPAALTEQIAHYTVRVKQYETQIQQYTTQIRQMENEYKHLVDLNYMVDLTGLNGMRDIVRNATGISNDFSRMQAQFESLYPDFRSYANQNGTSYSQQALQWSQQNQQNAKDILTVGSKLQGAIANDQDALRTLSSRSNSASGIKDLLQIMNQLLIIEIKQLMQLEQLFTTTNKANAAYIAQQAANDASGRAIGTNTLNDWDNAAQDSNYTVNPQLDVLH